MDIHDKPLLVPGPLARKLIGVGNTTYWALVRSGQIETVKLGGRVMVIYASLERLTQTPLAPEVAAINHLDTAA